jgi:hypothetical protein
MRSTNSAVGDDKPTGIEDLLRTSTNVNGKVTIRAAQVERRPSPSKLHLSTLWNPAAEDGLNTAQSSATNADDVKAEKPDACDLRSNVGESSKADDAGVRLQRRITNSTATVVNVTDLTKTKGQGEPVTVSREDSPTCNTYLRLLPDDYFEPSGDQLSKTALSPHTATSDNVAVDLKRSLSGSLENNGNRLTKNRPLSASMHNLVRPLPEVPKPTNIRHCSSSRHAAPSGGRRQTPASINNRPVRPFKKLLNFVSKQQQKYRRSAGDRTADSWSTSDADEHTNELDKIETITQVFGEENLYEPLRRPTNNNSSSCVRCQCQMRSTCSTCECVETRRECDDVSKVGGGGGGGINRWTVASDIPPNVQRFTINEVADCLRLLKMEKYVTPFAEQDVDGALLVTMDEDLLQDSFGMTGLEAKKIVEFAKNGWRPRT